VTKMNLVSKVLQTYDEVAAEYYDSYLHPTCANFSELSSLFLRARLQPHSLDNINILEVGCGRSVVATILDGGGTSFNSLTLLDQSPLMLEHSRKWESRGAKLIIADAQHTSLPSANYQLLISSLGDPYNGRAFWLEVSRLLTVGGTCLYTTPSFEWAQRFRRNFDMGAAEFLRTDGTKILVRSEIPTTKKQIELIKDAQLDVEEVTPMTASQLSTPPSSKLLLTDDTKDCPIVQCYRVIKPAKQ
jgi:hypothetical protein